MNGPQLPLITLAQGPWRAEVYDPRPDPQRLGARYVHGCWLRALWRDGRLITGAPKPTWTAFNGDGLPETFERPLAWGEARDGEAYLRIGSGLATRRPGEGWGVGVDSNEIERPSVWTIDEQGPSHLVMSSEDRLQRGNGAVFAYRLERRLQLREDGLDSSTRLRMQVPWSHPVCWFAHPFFGQTRADATALALPAQARVACGGKGRFVRGDDGLWRAGSALAGFGQVLGCWGLRGDENRIGVHCEGGGVMAVAVDRPLDHAVIWASQHACSPEHKLAREWKDGEDEAWTVSYRWL